MRIEIGTATLLVKVTSTATSKSEFVARGGRPHQPYVLLILIAGARSLSDTRECRPKQFKHG
jgi:hypothetical protein